MRKRDLGILLLAAFAVFFSLQHDGDLSFREAWYHLSDADYPIKHDADRLPSPLVADLNGDGKPEVLIPTHDAKIQVLQPHARPSPDDASFHDARLMADVSLLPSNVRVSSGRRPVAMAVGTVDRHYAHAHVPSKQLLVVVTSGWSVMCFDHNLKKLWEANLQDDFPHAAHHREVAISITNYTLKHGDAGLVIVGGRMEMQHHSAELLDEFMVSEHNREEHRRSASEKQASETGNTDLRHFALYAFAGRTGELRWSRKHENIPSQPSDASVLIPQHNYKLDAHALNSRHPGQDRREDTFLQLAHFRRHKRKALKKTPGKAVVNNVHKPSEHNPPGKDVSNRLANVIGKAADMANSNKIKKSQRTLYVPTITNYTQVWWVPNVVVAHEKEGIEAVHLASGQFALPGPLADIKLQILHLTEGGLHADINGDGVLDHVQVVGANGIEQTVVSGSMEVLKPCWAVATSGVPVREQLFNVSICHYNNFNLFHHGDFSRSFGRTFDTTGLEVATPILLQRDDGHKHRKGSHGDIIFLTSRGEVTSYSPGLLGHDAIWRWQLSTGATWSNLPSPSGMMENIVVPTLKAFSLRAYDPKQVIIVGGDLEAVVISPSGGILASIELPAPPTHALVLEDFSGDGLTDIILVTSGGVYGFVQTRHPGALFFSTLVGCLIVVIGVIFVSLHLNSSNSGKPRASTDYR
uniref:FG-GAP repeat-containing protein n=1 Tax=Oryza punctata TaxID=4537 RepID=A0A0E0MDH5_ORYPU